MELGGPLDPSRLASCRELFRSIPGEALDSAGSAFWTFCVDNADSPSAPPEAISDPAGGGLLVSHAWDPPEDWSKHFGAQDFAASKHLEVMTAVSRASRRGLVAETPGLWIDRFSVPAAVAPEDHPLDRVEFGPYRLTVRALKCLASGGESGGTYSTVLFAEAYPFSGTMRIHGRDKKGRLMEKEVLEDVKWEIPPGWYYARSAHVVPEGKITSEDADGMEPFNPSAGEPLRKWCTRLRLVDEVWVEFTLGSLRAECLELTEAMISLNNGLLVAAAWNYFDRLWPLCEWAMFCVTRGPERVQLAIDMSAKPALVEYHRALRRMTVYGAQCRCVRDRNLILAKLERTFCACTASTETSYQCGRWVAGAGIQPIVRERPGLPSVAKERVVDFGPLERYVRATAIGVWAREAILAASGEPRSNSEAGWASLAAELGFTELSEALKLSKPWSWHSDVAAEASGIEGYEPEVEYESQVEAWWRSTVLPVLENERRRAMTPCRRQVRNSK